jgi:uncharacterized protein YlxW (UPF0749 family)
MKKKENKFILMIAFIVLGIAMSMQFKSITNNNKTQNAVKHEYDQYIQQLRDEQETGEELNKKISNNIDQIEAYLLNSTDVTGRNTSLKFRWSLAKYNAGLTDVKGPGIIVSLSDSIVQSDDPMNSIIHDTDILKILNEIKKAGAQAISINDNRIISTSEIVCTGPTIRVNGYRYTNPFIIKAIGEKEKLYNLLEESVVIAILRQFNIDVKIEKKDNIEVYKYSGDLERTISSLEEVK